MRLEDMAKAALATPGDALALDFQGKRYDWRWMRATAQGVDRALETAGLGPGQPVIIAPGTSRPSAIATLLALITAGRDICPMLYPFQSAAGLAQGIGKLKLAAFLAAAEDFTAPVIAELRASGICGVMLDEVDGPRLCPDASRSTMAASDTDGAHAIHILSSGTTGAPEHFAVPYATIAEQMVRANMTFRADGAPELLYFSLANISGLYHYLPIGLNGKSAILLEKFDILAWRDYIRRYRPPIAGLPPPGVQMALDADITPEDLVGVRYIRSGAAAVNPLVARRFQDRFGIPLLFSYGATEFGGPVANMTPDLYERYGEAKFGSVGRAWDGARLRVVDPDSGTVLPPGAEGLLEVIAPRIGDDWIRTTDLVVIDEDGFVYHRGRADGAIMRGGFKLLPEVIEGAIMEHPDVTVVSVVGLADDRLGQVPVAAIQLRPGANPPSIEELEAHVRSRVYATHVPVAFRFVEALPRTPSLKVDMRAVRALFSDD